MIFPSRCPPGKVCSGFALCVSLSPRPNLCEYEQKLQWPLPHQRNGTSASSPSSGSRGGGQKRAGICPPAPDHPISNMSEIGVYFYNTLTLRRRIVLSARIKQPLNLRVYIINPVNNINVNNNNKR